MTAPWTIRVLGAHREPSATTNPYLTMLTQALRDSPDLEYRTFTFPRALLWRYDVLHLHWPEVMMGGHRMAGRAGRELLTVLVLLRLRMRRVPVVRTVHNLEVPADSTRIQRRLIEELDRLTTLRIVLNERTGAQVPPPCVHIPHGHYREWYGRHPRRAAVPGRLVFFGLARRYKGLENLARAFRVLPGDDLSLRICGRPSSPEIAAEIDGILDGDPRAATLWRYLDDPELVLAVSEAQLVVLPYRFMHNSGAALAALSLARPVLVPDTAVNRDLADEVGPGWVHLFTGELDAQDLAAALATLRESPPAASPDLSAREWEPAAESYLRAYREALALRAAGRPAARRSSRAAG